MDYEEFLWVKEYSSEILRAGYRSKAAMGNSLNAKLMRDFRIYMAVGGMPQAVERYIETNNLEKTDEVKRDILALYSDDLKKIDPTQVLN